MSKSNLKSNSIEEKILAVISKAVPRKRRGRGVTTDARLREDLGIDSMGLAVVVVGVESALGIVLGDTLHHLDVGQIRTVGDVIDVAQTVIDQGAA